MRLLRTFLPVVAVMLVLASCTTAATPQTPAATAASANQVTAASAATTASVAQATSAPAATATGSGEPVYFGLSAPLTGPLAEYGAYFKRGFGLALDEINASGGINGRPVALDWEDSQSDPKQSVAVAQKFVDDPRIIAELGDFSSTASMAASPTYERAQMVQYGYTNSSPDFTKGGEYMFAPGVSQATSEVLQTQAVAKYAKKVAVLYLDTSWGQTTYGIFKDTAQQIGLEVTYSAGYLDSTTDFRPLLINARDSNPDLLYDIGYDNDAAAILNQRADVSLSVPVFTAQLTSTGIGLSGAAAEGALTTNTWFPKSPEPRIQAFTSAFENKYGAEPGQFEVVAYDALYQVVYAAKKGGPTREGVYNALKTSTDIPSVEIGPFGFQSDRRPANPPVPAIVTVKEGQLVLTDKN